MVAGATTCGAEAPGHYLYGHVTGILKYFGVAVPFLLNFVDTV